MIDESKIGKLTVGDIADYEQWRRERRKEELIGIVKELYGDNIPGDALTQIEQSLRKIPSITDDDGFDLTAARFLFWRSMSKNDPDLTIDQVSKMLDISEMEHYSKLLFPANLAQKKRRRQPAKKKKATR